jgi:hypothetical protein
MPGPAEGPDVAVPVDDYAPVGTAQQSLIRTHEEIVGNPVEILPEVRGVPLVKYRQVINGS